MCCQSTRGSRGLLSIKLCLKQKGKCPFLVHRLELRLSFRFVLLTKCGSSTVFNIFAFLGIPRFPPQEPTEAAGSIFVVIDLYVALSGF